MIADNFNDIGSMAYLHEAEKLIAQGHLRIRLGDENGRGVDVFSGIEETQDYAWARVSYRDGTEERVPLYREVRRGCLIHPVESGEWCMVKKERHILVRASMDGTREEALAGAMKLWREGKFTDRLKGGTILAVNIESAYHKRREAERAAKARLETL